jgi:hypothetical protein
VHLLKVVVDRRPMNKIFFFNIRSKVQFPTVTTFCWFLSLRSGGIAIGCIKIVIAILKIIGIFATLPYVRTTAIVSKFY